MTLFILKAENWQIFYFLSDYLVLKTHLPPHPQRVLRLNTTVQIILGKLHNWAFSQFLSAMTFTELLFIKNLYSVYKRSFNDSLSNHVFNIYFLTFNLTRITDHCVIRSSNLINCSLCLWCWNICDSYRFHFLTRISIPVGHEICVCISKVSIINNPMK